jgi:hypothetical protein
MTKRHNNVGRIIVQAIETINRNNLFKIITGQYMHRNQELILLGTKIIQGKVQNFLIRRQAKEGLILDIGVKL